MEQAEVLRHFSKTGALLDGHFLLSSGLHSPVYLQCALALENSADARKFGSAIASRIGQEYDIVASPAIGGLVIGFATAAALDKRFIWTERQNGEMTLRRGFKLDRGDRILVVEDVITTGGSTRECIAALREHGADIVAAASIIDRSNGAADVGVPRIALATLDAKTYSADDCSLCRDGSIAVKPGSRI